MHSFVCASKTGVSFSPVPRKTCNQILLTLKARFPGNCQSLCQIVRLRSLTWGSEPLQQYENFFGITVLSSLGHPSSKYDIFDFIVIVLLPPSCYGFFFVLDVEYLFLVGSSVLLLIVVQWLVALLVLLLEGMSSCLSTLPSWTGSPAC